MGKKKRASSSSSSADRHGPRHPSVTPGEAKLSFPPTVDEDAPSPDPRWPLLRKWSATKLAVASPPFNCTPPAGTVSPAADPPGATHQAVASSDLVEMADPTSLQAPSGPIPSVTAATETRAKVTVPDPSLDTSQAVVSSDLVVVAAPTTLQAPSGPLPAVTAPAAIGAQVSPVSDPPLVTVSDPVEGDASTTLNDDSRPLPAVSAAAEIGEIHSSFTGPPLQGAWVRNFIHSSAHSQQGAIPGDVSRWPSLSEARAICTKQGIATRAFEPRAVEDHERFPWAAKMNPASRNLYRATEPEYMEDGTPKVTIPPEVMLQGIENQKDYILGQFYRCSAPPGGLIYAVFNKLWGRNCRITIRKLSDSTYLFHVPEESTRKWILQRGLWHVDDCLMFVASWTPEASLEIPEIKTIPVWVTLKKIPHILYSIPGISHIASGLGAPMATHKPRLDPIHMGEAKILVEVELSKAFPSRIAAGDSSGFISMVDVYYAWLPGTCSRCGQLGHKPKRCLLAEDKPPTADHSSDTPHLGQSGKPLTGIQDSKVQGTPQAQPTDLMSTDRIEAGSTPPAGNQGTGTIASSSRAPVNDSDNAGQTESQSQTGSLGIRRTMSSGALDTNRFSLLHSSDEEDSSDVEESNEEDKSSDDEDASDTNNAPEPTDFFTPSGKRFLRERPVVPTTKAREMQWHPVGGGRGNRGRGKGRGRGRG